VQRQKKVAGQSESPRDGAEGVLGAQVHSQ
jgi:hypothetical protein